MANYVPAEPFDEPTGALSKRKDEKSLWKNRIVEMLQNV